MCNTQDLTWFGLITKSMFTERKSLLITREKQIKDYKLHSKSNPLYSFYYYQELSHRLYELSFFLVSLVECQVTYL